MPYVWIDESVDTRLMNQYVKALQEMLTDPDGLQELGILQLCEELDRDASLYSAVWAHLDRWMRSRIKDIRSQFPAPAIVRPAAPVAMLEPQNESVITDDSIKF